MASHSVISPMTGRIVEIPVRVGEFVDKGDMVLVIESMKMENEIFSEVAGTITDIRVADDGTVSEGNTLMVIEVQAEAP